MNMPHERHSFSHNVELRARNKEIVDAWFRDHFGHGGTEGDSTDRYHPYVRYQRNFLPEGRREYAGLVAVTDELRVETARVTDWKWTDVEILATDYPQIVWALADATYRVSATGAPSANSYAYAFVLEDGKIRMIKEWLNPLPLLEEQGIRVPAIITSDLFGD